MKIFIIKNYCKNIFKKLKLNNNFATSNERRNEVL